MYAPSIFVTSALAAGVAAQIPPQDFGFPSASAELELQYPSSNTTPGIHYGVDVPKPVPTVSFTPASESASAQFLLLMVDPDASTPENPTNRYILHWLQPNLTVGADSILTNSTPAIASYRNPMPPPTSNPHRYIQYLFAQPAGFAIPPAFAGFNEMNRTKFNLTTFISDAGLDTPVAANYFLCSNQSSVPGTFIASPDGSFPSDNSTTPSPTTTGTGAQYTGNAEKIGISVFGLVVAAAVTLLSL